MNTAESGRVGAAIVFYGPDATCVDNANFIAQFVKCVVVDNSEAPKRPADLDPSIVYLPQGWNSGIAAAINRGVEALISNHCRYALLFDQDSRPAADLFQSLPSVFSKQASYERIAAVGPAYDDPRLGGVTPFVRFAPFRLTRVMPQGRQTVDIDFLISSGTCIDLQYWSVIGPMEEQLFIDFVDLEWCMRAKRLGFQIKGVSWLTLKHSLGSDPVRILGRTYPTHSAFRHYFIFRNSILLMLRRGVSWRWKSSELVKLPGRFIIYSFFMKPRREHFSAALRGIVHGLIGRTGPW